MKIIYIVNARIPTEKAHGLQIIRMCDAFAALPGIELELVVPKRNNLIMEDAFQYYNLKNKFKKIFVVPYRIADLYNKWGIKKENILVAPNGVDLCVFDLNINKEEALKKINLEKLINKNILVYTGSFKTKGVEKGMGDILKAMKELDRDTVFVAAGGEGRGNDDFQKKTPELKIEERGYLFGRQKQSDLAVYQKKADCLLMPFPDIAHYRLFMTPMKMFEYMASKRPIISSDLPSVRKVLNERNCFFCKPGDPHDLADKINKLLSEKESAQSIADRAFRDAQDYTWNKRAGRIINFIKK